MPHLTSAQLSQFRTEGYVFPFRGVSAAEAAEYRARIEAYEVQAGHDANRTRSPRARASKAWTRARHRARVDRVTMSVPRRPAALHARSVQSAHCLGDRQAGTRDT